MTVPRLAAAIPDEDQQRPSPTIHEERNPRPLSELGSKPDFEEHSGGRPGISISFVLDSEKRIILPYMSLLKIIHRSHEILLEFSGALVVLKAGENFSVDKFLEAVADLRVKTIVTSQDLEVTVRFEPITPPEECL